MRIILLCLLAQLLLGCAITSGDAPSSDKEAGENRPLVEVIDESKEVLPNELRQGLIDAQQMVSRGEHEEAKSRLLTLKQQFGTFPQIDLNLCLIAMKDEQWDDALAYLIQAENIRPNYAPTLNLKGVVFRQQGQFENAKSAYEKAVKVNPNYASAWLNLGVLADLYLQDGSLALSAFQYYLSLKSDDKKVEQWVVELSRRLAKSGENE